MLHCSVVDGVGEDALSGDDAEDVEQVAIDGLILLDGLGEGHEDKLVVLKADHDVALPLE